MKTMKQILCLALVAAMLLASGCSPATTPTGAESQPTQTSSTETTKSGQVASAEDMAGATAQNNGFTAVETDELPF